jgi:methylenetetrahydrofolate reductase (NADPH)
MKISDILKSRDKGISFEFFPPKTSKGMSSLAQTVALLKKYRPLYMSMTYGAGGGSQERTKEAVRMLLDAGGSEVMPHLTGVGMDSERLKQLLDEYASWGIDNIMALRGDPPCEPGRFDFSQQQFPYAVDLVSFIKKYDRFCLGVAVYPEGHIESPSLKQDIEYTRQKIMAGASFAVTQMFFDNSWYYRFLDTMEKQNIAIPVLPGILPLTDVEKVKKFASICRASIPSHIEEKMSRLKGRPQEMKKAGINFTIEQCRDLARHGVRRFHFFTLNKPEVITAIADAVSP